MEINGHHDSFCSFLSSISLFGQKPHCNKTECVLSFFVNDVRAAIPHSQSYAPPAARPDHWKRMTGLSRNFLMPPLPAFYFFIPNCDGLVQPCSGVADWLKEWVWVSDSIRLPMINPLSLSWAGGILPIHHSWHGRARTNRTGTRGEWATHRRAAKIPPASQHTYAHKETLSTCFSFCCLQFPDDPSSARPHTLYHPLSSCKFLHFVLYHPPTVRTVLSLLPKHGGQQNTQSQLLCILPHPSKKVHIYLQISVDTAWSYN